MSKNLPCSRNTSISFNEWGQSRRTIASILLKCNPTLCQLSLQIDWLHAQKEKWQDDKVNKSNRSHTSQNKTINNSQEEQKSQGVLFMWKYQWADSII